MAKPLLLVYHLPAQKLTRLRVIAIRLNVCILPVEKGSYLQPIGALCGVSEPFDALYDGEDFPEEMLVMAHFPKSLVTAFLQAYRAAKLPPVPLKAVLTETNAGWNSLELHEQLQAEHEAMKNGTSAHEQA